MELIRADKAIAVISSAHSCATVCGNSLTNEDRATGMSFCETLAQGLLGMVGPMVGASLVTIFGGVKVEGIRPLFFVSLLITAGTFFLILTPLPNRRWKAREEGKPYII